jgi:hypothetical protein
MKILNDIPCEIDSDEVFETLHLEPQHRYAGEVRALIDKAREFARPRAVYEVAFVEERETDAVVLVGEPQPKSSMRPGEEPARARFVSAVLRANLDEVERVFLYVVTCGQELDSISIGDDDVLGQFCWDSIKEMVLYAALEHLSDHLKETYALEKLISMNPGSGDIGVWPIRQQRELFAFFGDVQQLVGVELTDSCVMIPSKSVSGIFYASEHDFQTCQLCHRENCPQRGAPFDPHMWESRFGGKAAPSVRT